MKARVTLFLMLFTCSGLWSCRNDNNVSGASAFDEGATFSQNPNRTPSYGHDGRDEGTLKCRFETERSRKEGEEFEFVGYRSQDGDIYIKLTKSAQIWPNHVLKLAVDASE